MLCLVVNEKGELELHRMRWKWGTYPESLIEGWGLSVKTVLCTGECKDGSECMAGFCLKDEFGQIVNVTLCRMKIALIESGFGLCPEFREKYLKLVDANDRHVLTDRMLSEDGQKQPDGLLVS